MLTEIKLNSKPINENEYCVAFAQYVPEEKRTKGGSYCCESLEKALEFFDKLLSNSNLRWAELYAVRTEVLKRASVKD